MLRASSSPRRSWRVQWRRVDRAAHSTSFGHVAEQPEPTTDFLFWPLRVSVFGLIVLLFIVCRIRKSLWPVTHFPEVTGDLITPPSDLPAPVVSVLGQRKISPVPTLSILLDMLQKGNVTISGKYDEYDEKRELHSGVSWSRQSEPRPAVGKAGLRRAAHLPDQL